MSFGRIRRGVMAADQFTQIRNALFRDPDLSLKAKGLFGLISTHRDGWGVTPESLAADCTDGVSAIKSGLRELEAAGYLVRERERRENGTLGAAEYFITDDPDTIEAHRRRSEPTVENPPVDRPPVAEPTVDDRPHKKTNSKNTKTKNTTSPSRPHVDTAPAPTAAVDGEEGMAVANNDDGPAAVLVDTLPYRGRFPGAKTRAHLVARIADALAAGWTEQRLRDYLTCDTATARDLARVYRYRLEPDELPAAVRPAVVPAQRWGVVTHDQPEPDRDRECPGCDRPVSRPGLCRDCVADIQPSIS